MLSLQKLLTQIMLLLSSMTSSINGFAQRDTVPAHFPGGDTAWLKYIKRNINTDVPKSNGASPGIYSVTVRFVVDKGGVVTGVEAENDPGYGVAQEVISVIERSGQWVPATYKGQNIDFISTKKISIVVTDFLMRSRTVASIKKMYMDAVGVSSSIADSILVLQRRLNLTVQEIIKRPDESKNDKLTDVKMALSTLKTETQKLLSEEQYKRWIGIHGLNSSIIDIPWGYFYTSESGGVNSFTLRKLFADSLGATSKQIDSLMVLERLFGIKIKEVEADVSETKGERVSQVVSLLMEREKRVRMILNDDQYKRWVELHKRQLHKAMQPSEQGI